MAFTQILFALFFYVGGSIVIQTVRGQASETVQIPNSGDSCNVVNLNFGRGEENELRQRELQGPPGKRGSPGLPGLRGQKGEIGPQGPAADINFASVTTSVMKALGASSCAELRDDHGISETGYYLMRSAKWLNPTYNYCDFEIRTDVDSCKAVITHLGEEFKDGYYLIRTSDDHRARFMFCQEFPTSCQNISVARAHSSEITSGVFNIYSISRNEAVEVYCDLETDGGGWTVFQRRMDGSENFYRDWNDYVDGFGKKDGEFWIGLETIHQMTKDEDHELRIDLTDFSGNSVFAKYGTFSVQDSANNYRLNVGDYSGSARDSLINHNGMQFSTKNADHDILSSSCANLYHGAWWYNNCHYSNLNGVYHRVMGSSADGIVWYHWKSKFEYLKFTEMKLRKKMP